MKRIVIGIFAHVDAGKTTLSEAMLYTCGAIKKLGRVDHRDSFLDTYSLERERGITIFSKQALLEYKDTEVILIDTPGHIDFSTEAERTLQVLDYAVLVISGTDGVQSHTETLWGLLRKYNVPTFIFVNKMDLNVHNQLAIIKELQKQLDDGCVDFCNDADFNERIAVCDEELLEKFYADEEITDYDIAKSIKNQKIFPCYFGSALKMLGVDKLMNGLNSFTCSPSYPEDFGAKVYKISRDPQGNRLTYMKITGGTLKTRAVIQKNGWEEKVNQIRIYSGDKFTLLDEVSAGQICTVTGLSKTLPGMGLGFEKTDGVHFLEPVFTYRVIVPSEINVHDMFLKLKELEEEDPQLHIMWNDRLKEIHLQLMGEIQLEILKFIIYERFQVRVEFDTGNIVYKETITDIVEGIGHFEPLRHYAEVHLKLKPLEENSGLVFDTECSEDVLNRNWQRLIISNLEDKMHLGVLTGSPITDMQITLIAGKAHEKHTEGGDFRQAACRAVRQGLMKAKSVLLEPYYSFKIELPTENAGRAMSDIQQLSGTFDPPESNAETTVLYGTAPVATMHDYMKSLMVYTRGRGKIALSVCGYKPCHNQDEVLAQLGYDPDADVENTADSVFCSHGAGHIVKWSEVDGCAHIAPSYFLNTDTPSQEAANDSAVYISSGRPSYSGSLAEDKELMEIYERTYGTVKYHNRDSAPRAAVYYDTSSAYSKSIKERKYEVLPEYLLVDGYNVIFAWKELQQIAKDNLNTARDIFISILANYYGYCKRNIIIVFDAYKVKGMTETVENHDGVFVIYTKESQTADAYIERVSKEMSKKYRVTVATSDALVQAIIFGNGAFRISADEFKSQILAADKEIAQLINDLCISPSNRESKIKDIVKNKKDF